MVNYSLTYNILSADVQHSELYREYEKSPIIYNL